MEEFPVNEPKDPEPKSLKDLIAIVTQEQNDILANDKEYTEKYHYHMHTIIEAFAIGVLSSYPYYQGFQMPPNFEKVMNYMSLKLQEEFNNEEVPDVSLLKMRGIFIRLAKNCPDYVAWNDIGSGKTGEIKCVSRYDTTPKSPDFIDLDVPPRNAINYLRRHMRETKAFDEKFNKDWEEHKKRHPEIKFRD